MTTNQQPQQQQKPTEAKLAKRSPVQTLAFAIAQKQASFAAVATKYLTAERLVKLAQIAIAKTPALAECSVLSVVNALTVCSRLGLEPNEPGGVWLVPFREKDQKAKVCTPIVDYRGLIDVARRSGEIAAVHADLRCEADGWEYWIDTLSPVLVHLRHVPAEGDPGKERGRILGAYMIARLTNGQCQAVYLPTAKIEEYRGRSRAGRSDYSPWTTDWNAMAIKTACRRGVNFLPRSPELQALREALSDEDRELDVNEAAARQIRAVTDVPAPTSLPEEGEVQPEQRAEGEPTDEEIAESEAKTKGQDVNF